LVQADPYANATKQVYDACVKNLPAMKEITYNGDQGSISGSGRSPGEGNGNPL